MAAGRTKKSHPAAPYSIITRELFRNWKRFGLTDGSLQVFLEACNPQLGARLTVNYFVKVLGRPKSTMADTLNLLEDAGLLDRTHTVVHINGTKQRRLVAAKAHRPTASAIKQVLSQMPKGKSVTPKEFARLLRGDKYANRKAACEPDEVLDSIHGLYDDDVEAGEPDQPGTAGRTKGSGTPDAASPNGSGESATSKELILKKEEETPAGVLGNPSGVTKKGKAHFEHGIVTYFVSEGVELNQYAYDDIDNGSRILGKAYPDDDGEKLACFLTELNVSMLRHLASLDAWANDVVQDAERFVALDRLRQKPLPGPK